LALQSAGTTAIYVDTSQNVGINATPTAQFQVFCQDSASGKAIRAAYNSTYYTDYTETGLNCYNNDYWIKTKTAGTNLIFYTNNIERMRISSAGVVTTPYNPAFVARKDPVTNTSYSEVTGYDSTDFNTGSYFSTSTGRFTAPVAGIYLFFVDMGWTSNSYSCDICKNGSRYMRLESNGTQAYWIGTSVAISLAVNDYVSLYKSSSGNNSLGSGSQGGFGGFLIG
jgi:hypothetical protein